MNSKKVLRVAGLAALTVIALGAVGYALGGRDGVASDSIRLVEPEAAYSDGFDTDVMGQIDRALGRPGTSTIAPSAPGDSLNVAPMPSVAEDKAMQSLREPASGGAAGAPPVAPGQVAPGDTIESLDRKIVQTASLRLQVKEVGGSFEEVGRIATASGGFVASSNFTLQGEAQVAAVTIRVPADRYQSVLGELRRLGHKVDAEASNASDVTQEYSDLSARLRTLEATEQQLIGFMAQARNVTEVLQVQDRLNSIRGQIEQVKGRMALLDKLGDLATITVHLRPVVPASTLPSDGPNLGVAISEAWESSLEFLGNIAAGVLTVVVFAWWLPFVAVPAYLVLRRRSLQSQASAVD
jgi:hypothetical protein